MGTKNKDANLQNARGKVLTPAVRDSQRSRIHAKLDAFLDRVESERPRVDDGNVAEFQLEGGVVSFTESDEALFDFAIKVAFTENNV